MELGKKKARTGWNSGSPMSKVYRGGGSDELDKTLLIIQVSRSIMRPLMALTKAALVK